MLLYDNVRGGVDSPTLERIMTQPHVEFRSVGKGKLTTRRRNGLTILFTDNGAVFSPDIRRRLISIETAWYEDVDKQISPIGDPKEFIATHAADIESELNGIIARWVVAGNPRDMTVVHSMGDVVQIVGGMLKLAGFTGFLADQDYSRSTGDIERQGLARLAEAKQGEWQSATQLHAELARIEQECELSILAELIGSGHGTPASRLGRILRHTFISSLASGGVHPKTAQTLARHSSVTLTMDRYTHLQVADQAAALAALPDLDRPQSESFRGTESRGQQSAS